MPRPKQRLVISDFSGGLVTFPSPLDMRENQFQNFGEVNNLKIGRIEKVKGPQDLTAAFGGTNTIEKGQGFHIYRTEYGPSASGSTVWYVVYRQNGTSDMTFIRYDKSDGTGGSWAEIFDETTWPGTATKIIDMFDHNQVLRFSDANFTGNTGNNSQWYGYLKRDRFGISVSYTSSGKFKKPPQAAGVADWFNYDTTLTPPTIVSMEKAFDRDEDVEAAGKVGIHIHYPDAGGVAAVESISDQSDHTDGTYESVSLTGGTGAGVVATIVVTNSSVSDVTITTAGTGYVVSDQLTIPHATIGGTGAVTCDVAKVRALLTDLDSENFKNGDKYTCTFTYDYVQESALGKNGDEIGVRALSAVQNAGKRVPGIQLVVNTTSWNNRITGINLYWNPEGDVDWYLVAQLDVKDAWVDDVKATEISAKHQAGSAGENMGNWIPVPDWTTARSEVTLTGGSATAWTDSGGGFSGYAAGDIVLASVASGPAPLGEYDTMVSSVSSKTSTELTLPYNAIDYTDTEDSDPTGRYVNGGPPDGAKVATWYIPNDGFNGYTYQAFTGRYAGQKVPAIRWRSSTVIHDRAFYGNVDTEDENEQTVRERSRVYWTPVFKLDEISPGKYKDFGRNDGDEIMSLEELDGRLYVLKENNVYIYNVSSGSEMNWFPERHYRGVGCANRSFSTKTRYGVVCGNSRQVSLITPQEAIELSLPIRSYWRDSTTFDNGSMSYSPLKNCLIVHPDSDGIEYLVYNFDLRSWSKESHTGEVNKSNITLDPDQEVVYAEDSNDTVREMNAVASTRTVDVLTKQFDFGAPDIKKRFGRIYITYKTDDPGSDSLTVKAYLDGGYATATIAKTLTFDAATSLTNAGDFLNLVGKSLELRFQCSGENFILDDVIVEYTMMGHTP